jgi:hypothetical protein
MIEPVEALDALNDWHEQNPVRMMRQLSLAGWLVVALCAPAGAAYLPVVGPPALRFAPPPPPPPLPAALIPLPPLAVVEPRPAPPLVDPLHPAVDSTSAALDPVLIDPFAVPPVADPVPSPAMSGISVVPPEPLVPQMFMKYFIGGTGTNGSGVSVFSPVDFVPPLPIIPPSSSATFQTVPPGKP